MVKQEITDSTPIIDLVDAKPIIGNIRWKICALLFFSTAICYIDRQIISILKPQMEKQLHWSEEGYANIVSVFQFTYAVGYVVGGRFMDKFGVKRGMPIAVLLWSLVSSAHGFARSTMTFCFARAGLAISEGGNFPGAIRTVSDWFPVKERALATGIFNCASSIGAIACPIMIPWIAIHFGWQTAFFLTGSLGVIWVACWVMIYNDPQHHPRLSAAERQYIESGQVGHVEASVPWLSLLKIKAFWVMIISGTFSSPVWVFLLFWTPDFLSKRYHLNLQQTGNFTAIAYVIAMLGSIGGGWLAEVFLKRGLSLTAARKMALLCAALCALPVCIAATVHNIWISVIVIGLAGAANQASAANTYSISSDIMPKNYVSSMVGLSYFVGGCIGPLVWKLVGHVLTIPHGYVYIFEYSSVAYLLALAILHIGIPKIEPYRVPMAP